jgi:hypothetical protein
VTLRTGRTSSLIEAECFGNESRASRNHGRTTEPPEKPLGHEQTDGKYFLQFKGFFYEAISCMKEIQCQIVRIAKQRPGGSPHGMKRDKIADGTADGFIGFGPRSGWFLCMQRERLT